MLAVYICRSTCDRTSPYLWLLVVGSSALIWSVLNFHVRSSFAKSRNFHSTSWNTWLPRKSTLNHITHDPNLSFCLPYNHIIRNTKGIVTKYQRMIDKWSAIEPFKRPLNQNFFSCFSGPARCFTANEIGDVRSEDGDEEDWISS